MKETDHSEEERLIALAEDIAPASPSNQTDLVVIYAFLTQFKPLLTCCPCIHASQPLFEPRLLERAIADEEHDADREALRLFLQDLMSSLMHFYTSHVGGENGDRLRHQHWLPQYKHVLKQKKEMGWFDETSIELIDTILDTMLSLDEESDSTHEQTGKWNALLWTLSWQQRVSLLLQIMTTTKKSL